jgi:hypothetical protein
MSNRNPFYQDTEYRYAGEAYEEMSTMNLSRSIDDR